MNNAPAIDSELTRRSIEREMDLVDGAIRMVGGGGAPAVTLIGLDFGPAVLTASTAAAQAAGVVLEALWLPDESGCDIRIRRMGPEADHD
jgi:hypothetical protein